MKELWSRPAPFGAVTRAFEVLCTDQNWIISDEFEHHLIIADQESSKIIGDKGSADGQFHYPTGLAIHDQSLFVCDSWNHRVQRFSLDGNHQNTTVLEPQNNIRGALADLDVRGDSLGVLFSDAQCIVLYEIEKGGLQFSRKIEPGLRYPQRIRLLDNGILVIDKLGLHFISEDRPILKHALKNPSDTLILKVESSEALLFDSNMGLGFFWSLETGAIRPSFELKDHASLVLAMGSEILVYQNNSINAFALSGSEGMEGHDFNCPALLEQIEKACEASELHSLSTGVQKGRWLDTADYTHPLAEDLFAAEELYARDKLLAALKSWSVQINNYLTHASSENIELSAKTILNFLERLVQKRLERTATLKSLTDVKEHWSQIFQIDLQQFWSLHVQYAITQEAARLFSKKGISSLEIESLIALAQTPHQHGALDSLSCAWLREQKVPESIKDHLVFPQSTGKLLEAVGPLLEDELMAQESESPEVARASRIRTAYLTDLMKVSSQKDTIVPLWPMHRLIDLLRAYYWAGLEEKTSDLIEQIQINPHIPGEKAANWVGQIFVRMNQAEKACELFELGSYGKSFVYALARFHSGEARKAFDHMARFPQDHRTPVLSGMLHLFQDDFDSAASHFETAIKILPSVEAYFLLVLTRLYMQQPQKSLELIEQSKDLVPGECQSYLRACVLRSMGELEASLNELESVKSFSMIHYQKAVSLRCMGKYEEALELLALEQAHFPKWINIVQKALVFAACGNESGLKQSCSELAPHHWVLWGNKRIYASSKEFENALQCLAQLEQSDWGTLTRDEYLTLAKVHSYAHFTELTVSNFF